MKNRMWLPCENTPVCNWLSLYRFEAQAGRPGALPWMIRTLMLRTICAMARVLESLIRV